MYGVDKSLQPRRNGHAKTAVWSERVLLFVTNDAVPECLVHAIKREFPWITLERVSNLAAACRTFQHAVILILIDAVFFEGLDSFNSDLNRIHPSAIIAMMQDDRTAVPLQEVVTSPTLRGVLPMNLKLDVWLSVVRLMLHGGEYLPPAMVHSLVRTQDRSKTDERGANGSSRGSAAEHGASADGLGDLTAREIQILEMVSRGLQNKTIAALLSLSENTIKIHIHNIITKLGVHNRTQAAGLFRDGRETDSGAKATRSTGSAALTPI